MLTEKFDAYGELSPAAPRDGGKATTPASAALGRVGQGAFWLLVVIIVSARIISYPAAPSFDVGKAGEPKQAVTR